MKTAGGSAPLLGAWRLVPEVMRLRVGLFLIGLNVFILASGAGLALFCVAQFGLAWGLSLGLVYSVLLLATSWNATARSAERIVTWGWEADEGAE